MITTITKAVVSSGVSTSVQVTTLSYPGPQGASGGIPEAPLTGGPYGRDAEAWAPVMSPLLYDPAGVRGDCFDLANLSGILDGGVFN